MTTDTDKDNLFDQLKKLAPSELANFDQDIKQPESELIKPDSSEKKALDYAIRILAIRDYSIHKMKEKLKARQYSESIIENTINKLLEYNYIRENEYTKSRIKQLLYKGFSNQYIIQKVKLEKLHVDNDMIELVKDEFRISTEENICYLIEKKMRNKIIPTDYNEKMKFKKKIISFLASKGYNFDEINQNISKYV